jgi:hypothetical protein
MTGAREFYERIKERVETVWPLEPMEYGTLEFGVHDLNGYTLAFAEPLGRIAVARSRAKSDACSR